MFFLNLTATEFLALFGILGGLISLLYLLDRSKRRKMVSTLRFWTPARSAAGQQSRKKVRDPLSFLLQLAALLLLLLAIAQLQWGKRERQGHDHLLLIDTSAWSAQIRADNSGSVIDEEKRLALKYVHGLAKRDRVLIARVSGIASPVTSFTNDQAQLAKAISETEPDFSALSLDQAFDFAKQAQANQRQAGSRGMPGDVLYLGPGMAASEVTTAKPPERLRVITVTPRTDDIGLTRLEVHRDPRTGNGWQATITAKNYGPTQRETRVDSQFGVSHFTPRRIQLAAGQEASTTVNFTTTGPGKLEIRLASGHSLAVDDTASIGLPDAAVLSVDVFTDRPDVLRPLLQADHRLTANLYSTKSYTPHPAADVMLIDGFAPAKAPQLPALWINPPREHSPLRIKDTVKDAIVAVWHSESGVSSGLHAKETRIPEANVFEAFQGDVPVASVATGDVVLGRTASANHPALAAIGFDPLSSPLRYEVTTPLLVSHLLNWLAPESRRQTEFTARPLGAATVTLDVNEDTTSLAGHRRSWSAGAIHLTWPQFEFVCKPSLHHPCHYRRA